MQKFQILLLALFVSLGLAAQDVTPPTAKCQDIVVHLDVNGQVQISPADIDAGSSDDLTSTPALSMSLSPNTFGLSAVGKELAWKPLGQRGLPLNSGPSSATNQSLAIAPDGTPYISQSLSAKNNVLKWDGTAWQELPFTTQSLSYGYNQTLAIAPNGTPYLAYRDFLGYSDFRLLVLEWTGSTWQQVGVPNLSTNSPDQMKFTIAADGTLYLGYVEFDFNTYESFFHLLKWTGSTWQAIGGPATFTDYVDALTLAVAPNGTPYISGFDYGVSSGFVKKWTGTSWQSIGAISSAWESHLAIAPDGTPYFTYSGNNYQTVVLKYDGTSWQSLNFSGTNATLGLGSVQRIAIAPDGTPFVSYQDVYKDSKTTILKWDGNDWQLHGQQGVGNALEFTSGYSADPYPNLSIAPDGSIYVAYQDRDFGGRATVLKWIDDNYTTLTVSDAAGNSSTCRAWVNVEPNPSPVAKCQDITVELNLAGQVTIAPSEVDAGSFDEVTPSLSLSLSAFDLSALGKQQAWEIVGGGSKTAAYYPHSQIVTTPNGIYLAYLDASTSNYVTTYSLVVFKENGNGWQQLGASGIPMNYVSSNSSSQYCLSIAPDGTPYLAYTNKDQYNRTSVVKWDGSTWQTVHDQYQESIATSYGTFDQKLRFAPDGTPYLALREGGSYYSGPSLRVYVWQGGRWLYMDTYGFLPYYNTAVNDFALAPDGTPYIAYRNDFYNYTMSLAKWHGSGWQEISGTSRYVSGDDDNHLVFAPDGTPYYASLKITGGTYYGPYRYRTTVTRWDGSSWQELAVPSFLNGGTSNYYKDFAISPNGIPFMTYSDYYGSSSTNLLKWDGTLWQEVGEEIRENSGGLAFAPNGMPYLCTNYNFTTTVRKWDGDNFTTLTATDALGQSSQCRAWVTVEEASCIPPAAFASQGCGSCGQIRYDLCEGDPAPDLEAYVLGNSNYISGASLIWYADNSGAQGSLLAGAPAVNTAQTGTDWYWVAQEQETDCPGPAIRVRARVKSLFTPDFTLPAIGCGGSGQVNLASYVSDSRDKATAYTFYSVDPQINPGATPIGTATASNGVVNFGQQVNITVGNGNQTYWVQSTVPNGCGGFASSTLNAPAQSASLNPIPNQNVSCGDPVNIAFSGQNTTMIIWFDLAVFNNPNIGIMGNLGTGNLAFTATNTSGTPQTATIRVVPYNGNCAGQHQDFTITVQSGANCRQAAGNSLQLAASRVNAHDVALDWDIRYASDLIRFEVEKKRNDGDFEAIGYQDWQGNGAYQYLDKSSMANTNLYRLKLVLTDGRIVWSEAVEVKMDFFDNHRFNLFPNPTAGQFQLKALFPIEESYNWQLSDVMGKTLMQGKMERQEMTIQIESLATGVYHLVMISPEGKRYLMKVVKQ